MRDFEVEGVEASDPAVHTAGRLRSWLVQPRRIGGTTYGGGGFVDTDHRGVVNVAVEDEDGRHSTHELPSEMALLEGSTLRLDLINDRIVCATNLTGRQGGVVLLGPSAFIGTASFTKRHGVLMLATVLMAGQILSSHPIAGLAMTGALATLPLMRMREKWRKTSIPATLVSAPDCFLWLSGVYKRMPILPR